MRRNNPLQENDDIDGISRFKEFFLDDIYKQQIQDILFSKEKDIYHSLRFNFMDLLDYDMKLADFLMTNPDRALDWADTGVFQAQSQLCNSMNPTYKKKQRNSFDDAPRISIKLKCKARIIGQLLYLCRTRPTVSDIRSKDVSTIIQIRGTVIRQSKAKLLEASRKYSCLVCNNTFTVSADIINEKDIEFPKECPSNDRSCKSKKFQAISDSTEAIDFQEIHLQEQIQKIGLGKIPRSIRVVLTCDLSDSCQPGDDIEIIGIVRYHWSGGLNSKKSDSRFDIQMYIEAISLSRTDIVSSSDNRSHLNYTSIFDKFWRENGTLTPIRARNMILANLCPQLCGMYIIKLAVALTIIGGIPREEYGTRIRGQSHLLLVGDPGTGKSQLLRYAARMSTRSVLTTGVGTTSAGLTVSAVKDGGEWVLEAGALVLADGGICCIDEFGSVREHDRGVIHEAMEQQTISVAKGGFVCSLNSRSTVLAAMNPPAGGFDENSDLSLNTNMATSLLSRFDVILLLLDQKNDEWDRKVGQHLMDNLCEPEFLHIDYLYDDDTQQTPYGEEQTPFDDNNHNRNINNHQPEWNSTAAFERDMARFDEMREERVHWTIDQMQAYFALIRQKNVIFTDGAQRILTEYYQLQRNKEMRDKSRTTIRLLESLIRLAQAHCRLMYREQVLPLDAIQAVYLMEKSLCTTNSISNYSVLQTVFPKNAQESYEDERQLILSALFPNEWDDNQCRLSYLKDIQFDYKQDIIKRELAETEALAANEPGLFDDDLFNYSNSCGNELKNDEFIQPVTSLTQKFNSLSQNNDNNNKKNNNETPPNFGKRRKIRNVNYISPTFSTKQKCNSGYGTLETVETQINNNNNNNNRKRTRQEIMGENEDNNHYKRMRLNGNNIENNNNINEKEKENKNIQNRIQNNEESKSQVMMVDNDKSVSNTDQTKLTSKSDDNSHKKKKKKKKKKFF